MALYRYRAIAADGTLHRGRLEWPDRAGAGGWLRRRGLEPLELRRLPGRSARLDRPGRIELHFLLQRLVEAGIPLLEVLDELQRERHAPALRSVAGQLALRVEGGETLAAAMASLPAAFDPLGVALVAVGERCGRMGEALGRVQQELAWRERLLGRLRRSLIYPAVTLAVVTAVALFLLLEVVPGLIELSASLGRPPPAETRWLLALVEGLEWALPWAAALLAPLGVLLWGALRLLPAAALAGDRLLLRAGWIGRQLRRAAAARICRALAALYGGGVALNEALPVAARAAGNRELERLLLEAAGQVAAGAPLSRALDPGGGAAPLPPLTLRMVEVGERSGTLEAALEHAAAVAERRLDADLERAQALLEPLLTLLLGGMLGWIVLAVLGPVFDLVGGAALH